jgi:hypothetical protein
MEMEKDTFVCCVNGHECVWRNLYLCGESCCYSDHQKVELSADCYHFVECVVYFVS